MADSNAGTGPAVDALNARLERRSPSAQATGVPGVHEGALGMRFIEAVVASAAAGGAWTDACLAWPGEED